MGSQHGQQHARAEFHDASAQLNLWHQGWLGDHLSIADTTSKVIEQSYWPRVQGDVWRFCQACNECQEAT